MGFPSFKTYLTDIFKCLMYLTLGYISLNLTDSPFSNNIRAGYETPELDYHQNLRRQHADLLTGRECTCPAMKGLSSVMSGSHCHCQTQVDN